MHRRGPLAFVFALALVVAGAHGCHRHAAPPLALEGAADGPITFPAPEGWVDREPLPPRANASLGVTRKLEVSSPALDEKRHFEFEGQTLRLYFNAPVIDMKDAKKAPALAVTPAVKGKTVWTGPSSVELTADKPFDPDTEYTVDLPELSAPGGQKLEGGFHATFKAVPNVEVAGKIIHYVPKKGHARPIVMRPNDDTIGGPQEVTIVYDQPLDLGAAQRLVTMTVDETKIAAAIRHPDASAFEGQKIDVRFILLAKPAAPLAPKTKLAVSAGVEKEGEAIESTFTIADPPVLDRIDCGQSIDCEVKVGRVRAPSSTSLHLVWNNPIGTGWVDGSKFVKIAPQPKNVYVSGWNDMTISAAFMPSTTYTIRIAGMRDQYGGAVPAETVTFETMPLPASATLGEGVTILDEDSVKKFVVTTRNVERCELALWALPKDDPKAFSEATHATTPPAGDPDVVAFAPKTQRDELVDTVVDLSRLERGRAYVAQARIAKTAHGAKASEYPAGSDAARPATGVLFPAGPNALAAHVHQAGESAVVEVFRLAGGEPVAGAHVTLGGATADTDANGAARLAAKFADADAALVKTNDATLFVPIAASSTNAMSLFPDLASREDSTRDKVGMIVTDRGVYRPGSKMFVKGFVRKVQDARIAPAAGEKLRLRVIDPMSKDVADEVVTSGDRGTIAREVTFDKNGHTGRFAVRLELDDGKHTALAEETVRVADFEAPKFKVDVEPDASGADRVKAHVVARYLFGAPMDGAKVSWVMKKSALPVNGGAFADQGFSFDTKTWWYWDEDRNEEDLKPVTGEGTLAADGTLPLDLAAAPLAKGPTEIVLEADVTDASYRHVAGRTRVVRDPYAHHAGLELSRRFGGVNEPLRIAAVVVDQNGKPAAGLKIAARLERITWGSVTEKAESGALVEKWKSKAKPETQCDLTSAEKPVSCELSVASVGDYRVVAVVDGRDDAVATYWAWGGRWESDWSPPPSNGKKVPLVLDKARYKSGDTAKLLVQSPWKKAIAMLTVEQGGVLRSESKRIDGPSTTFDVPVTAANVPWVYAAVTLLPIGEPDPEFRVGAVRIPVGAGDATLTVHVASAKKQYEVRDDVDVTIEVKRGDQPVKNADVTLAVVDEGVLRMTAYHPKDPASALRPGKPLAFRAADSRLFMMRRREKAHAAGGGDSSGEDELDTRRTFVETAAWVPDLVTDDKGVAHSRIRLPDNLTEFRMTAVVVGEDGSGGTAESSFVVTKPLMLEPVMPRFVARGDTFEAAAMAHNNTDAEVAAKVTVAGESRDVTLAPRSRQRVSVRTTASEPGTHKMRFALEANGKSVDKVEIPLHVEEPGIVEHPTAHGVFGGQQIVNLEVPADITYDPDAAISIKTGSALYPELGQRLTYLLGYPHGCVEQTTSSTIPLLAARTILPWTGVQGLEDDELRKRIEAGVERLATMQTPSGGLAYWPGGTEPNEFGSAYALRALLRAKEMGIERPKLIDGVSKYLVDRLAGEQAPGLRASVAEVLARANALPESAADSLWDSREKLDAFGLASLAVALASLPKQDERVKDVLDRLEASFDADGKPTHEHGEKDWWWWSSDDRDRAQAVITLVKLRKESKLLPVLASRLSRGLDRWTTQSTAWSLLALADFVGTRDPDGSVDVTLKLEGRFLDTYKKLGGDNKEVRIPLKDVAGKKLSLVLTGDAKTPSAFAIEATWKRPLGAPGTHAGKRAKNGVSVHRAYTDAKGNAIDLAHLKAGQIVRVAIRAELPKMDAWRMSYIAITDRLPGGLEAIDPDLATTAYTADLSKEHPFYDGLTSYGASASHIDRRDDRVQIYFDRGYGKVLYATYLARATTPGKFVLPPANSELMYEPDSEGWSDGGAVTIE